MYKTYAYIYNRPMSMSMHEFIQETSTSFDHAIFLTIRYIVIYPADSYMQLTSE